MALEAYPKILLIDEKGEGLIDTNEGLRLAWMKGFIKAKQLYRNIDKEKFNNGKD